MLSCPLPPEGHREDLTVQIQDQISHIDIRVRKTLRSKEEAERFGGAREKLRGVEEQGRS